MTTDDAITYPVIGHGFPEPGSFALMVATQSDLQALCRLFHITVDQYYALYMSRLYVVSSNGRRFSIVGPLVGAPYAAMILETLIAGGVTKVLFWGWCGAVSVGVRIGDIIVPNGAIIDEGTSRHYGSDFARISAPSSEMTKEITAALTHHRLDFHEGAVWTTDAIFRETRAKVEAFQSQDMLAVEMETSALFTVGKYRAVKVGALLVVSDELATFTWKPGFKDPRFKQNRRKACNAMGTLCQNL
ncbi:MAG: nucleoside phosphorylase [Desulfobacterales bacterium]|nr:nucleoside phosphorylase [Desulfobacterales bacterium]